MVLQTEYEFALPKGYLDDNGKLHKKGIMRLAVGEDEILAVNDIRVRRNQAYLAVILLSRVITRLGDMTDQDVTPVVIEKLFVGDLSYLQELYHKINGDGNISLNVSCPKCGEKFDKEITSPGE